MESFRFTYLFVFIFFIAGCKGYTENIYAPNAVAELRTIDIGGMEQWILIRGENRSNPILLWLHGGPGAAQMPVHHAFNRELEKEFVVVHWDQRGAGKSNHKTFDDGTMTMEQFIEDLHELTQYLKERFNRNRIVLLGHSWGTQFGILAVQRFPEDYHAYISVSQVVHPQRSDHISYEWLKKQIDSNGSRRQKRKLNHLGEPHFDDHSSYVAFANLKDSFGGGMDIGFGRLAWNALIGDEYTFGDSMKWLRGANRGSRPMWHETRDFDLFRDVPELHVPVWFIVGSNDYNTPASLIEEYYEFVNAPRGKS